MKTQMRECQGDDGSSCDRENHKKAIRVGRRKERRKKGIAEQDREGGAENGRRKGIKRKKREAEGRG